MLNDQGGHLNTLSDWMKYVTVVTISSFKEILL